MSEATGVLGGTFNPPHYGHVALARAAIRAFRLERLVVMVAGRPPHKQVSVDAETRFQLARSAFAELSRAELSRHELERDDYAYTVDTARFAQETWGDVVFLVGADGFADFPSWRDPERILEHVRLGVAARPGIARARLDEVLRSLDRPERVVLFEMPPVDISSSDIRRRVAEGLSIDGLVPPAVARLVEALDLYRR